MKKSLLLRALTVAGVLSAAAAANAYDFEIDGVYYKILSSDDKTVAVCDNGAPLDEYYQQPASYSGEVSVPATVVNGEEEYTVTTVADGAFENSSELTSVTLPETITTIEYSAFQNCSGLTTLVVPDAVEKISIWAFSGCSSLESIVLGKSLKSIAWGAFDYTYALTQIDCLAVTPPTLSEDDDPFYSGNYYSATLRVPAESIDAYKEATCWKNFETVEALPESGVAKVWADSRQSAVYDLNGRYAGSTLQNLDRGIYIVKAGEKTYKVKK